MLDRELIIAADRQGIGLCARADCEQALVADLGGKCRGFLRAGDTLTASPCAG